jgi:hypothetical protein
MTLRAGGKPLVVVAALFVGPALAPRAARAQETPSLPPPPPPSSPQYTPPPTPPPAQTTAPPGRHEREREPAAPHKEREKEREREREREKEREREREASMRVHYAAPPPPVREGPPPAARSIQVGIRTGVSIPAGAISADPGDGMNHDFSVQVPFLVEVGVKVHRVLFFGGYGGFALGGASSDFANAQGCSGATSRSCGSLDLRFGLELQVHMNPSGLVNPWLGYGLGFESAQASASGGGQPATGESFTGFEFARIGGGADIRVSRYAGFGPFAEIDLGSYSHEHVQGATQSADEGIPNTSVHGWFTFGLRGVIFP